MASQAMLVDIQSGGISEEMPVGMPQGSVELKVIKLAEWGVKTLICGAISKPALLLAQSQGMRVFSFVAGEVGQVLRAFQKNCLNDDAFRMPGCRRRYRCGRGHGGQRRSYCGNNRPL
ncbi:dinitrogenase iron-molybdenum cofactor biosynthesis protein [candidate division FCPU426 bacterium]|nr:dinitrogenase iron-molybdenum cofactor biosynthesis protein [candidate division FCPU426 bacterium]